jgi:hypothetical protein
VEVVQPSQLCQSDSWFAALGVLGDVFCDLEKHLESFVGCGLDDRSVVKDDIGQLRKASENNFKTLIKHLDLRSHFISKGDSDMHKEVHNKLWCEALIGICITHGNLNLGNHAT